jgi:hypothetical protein
MGREVSGGLAIRRIRGVASIILRSCRAFRERCRRRLEGQEKVVASSARAGEGL